MYFKNENRNWQVTEWSKGSSSLYFGWLGSILKMLKASTCELFRWCLEGENIHLHDTLGTEVWTEATIGTHQHISCAASSTELEDDLGDYQYLRYSGRKMSFGEKTRLEEYGKNIKEFWERSREQLVKCNSRSKANKMVDPAIRGVNGDIQRVVSDGWEESQVVVEQRHESELLGNEW